MKFFIVAATDGEKREINEAVYTAIATSSSEDADVMVRNVTNWRKDVGWSLKCE